MTLVNAACSEKKGNAQFFITPNRVSSSLSVVSTSTHDENHPQRDFKEIEVDTINLLEYLTEEGIEYIDYYLSDTQGSDLNILKTEIKEEQPEIDSFGNSENSTNWDHAIKTEIPDSTHYDNINYSWHSAWDELL